VAQANLSGVQDAPIQIVEAQLRKATATLPEFCDVQGYIAPQVGFRMGLPSPWNGKFLEVGCGGHCGFISDRLFDIHDALGCGAGLRKGFACIASDMGHKGTGADGAWAFHNWQAKLDWGYRATHVVALAGKAIATQYYAQAPRRAYFSGCSTGGRQGLQEAQRFPADFDGILAGAPPVELSAVYVDAAWKWQLLKQKDGTPVFDIEARTLLRDDAVKRCDMDDGVRDGIIGNPLHCTTDPDSLACKSGETKVCLTALQIDVAKRLYRGPIDSSGNNRLTGGATPGTEAGWVLPAEESGFPSLVSNGLRFLFLWPEPGPSWTLKDFDFALDHLRVEMMEPLYDASNPDLRRFRDHGGKLIAYDGYNDGAIARGLIDYYQLVARAMEGNEKTQSFFRLFVMPGVGHCVGGDGADTVDYFGALEAWVERGEPPGRLIAAHLKGSPDMEQQLSNAPSLPLNPAKIQFTRPLYPYPLRPMYVGHGDPADANNFRPTMP
jgi:feruloyl esterase